MTILVVVSVCSPINRFPFDCFFFLFKQFLSHAETVAAFSASANFRVCKHGPLSWRTRPCRSPSRSVIGVTQLGTHPFSPHRSISLASFALPRYPFPFALRAGFKYAKRLFFPRRVGFFPCLVRRAHIITGWRENNGQKNHVPGGASERNAMSRKKR